MLNDYVAHRHRAKWNSLESLNNFSWSGSAMLGGVIVDKFGYRCDAQQRRRLRRQRQPHHHHHHNNNNTIVYNDTRRRRCTFLITAGLQTLSFLILVPLAVIVTHERRTNAHADAATISAGAAVCPADDAVARSSDGAFGDAINDRAGVAPAGTSAKICVNGMGAASEARTPLLGDCSRARRDDST